ncbi:hypothetical protein EB796_008060 [Bugula neritina]|uniref:Uncharacterized protein n=1 Tax=Bugula neritina TaxID=10212 RepID=A0A7J7K5Z2_BUGNE|nr:hypothetical protein EB796_008060 [Bugula neritina]
MTAYITVYSPETKLLGQHKGDGQFTFRKCLPGNLPVHFCHLHPLTGVYTPGQMSTPLDRCLNPLTGVYTPGQMSTPLDICLHLWTDVYTS